MAEKVSKYNVNSPTSLLFYPKCPLIKWTPDVMLILFTLNSGLTFLYLLPNIRSLNVLSLWWVCTRRRWRRKQRRRPTNRQRGGHLIGMKICRWIALMKRRSSGCWRNLRNSTHDSPTAETECSCNTLSECSVSVWDFETLRFCTIWTMFVRIFVLHKWRIGFN